MDGLRQKLDDVKAEVDYSAVEAQYTKYKKNKGKKSLAERKEDYKVALLCITIIESLGAPGTPATTATLNFDALEQNGDIFIEFLTENCRKADGGIMKDAVYKGFRSSLTYLYRRYRRTMPDIFSLDLKDSMEGIIRVSTEARQNGEGNIYDGDRPLS